MLKVIVLDLGGGLAYGNRPFRLTLKTSQGNPRGDRRPRYTTVYRGVPTPAQVSLDKTRFELALRQLPIEPRSLRSGTAAQLEITALPFLGAHSAEQTLTWQGTL